MVWHGVVVVCLCFGALLANATITDDGASTSQESEVLIGQMLKAIQRLEGRVKELEADVIHGQKEREGLLKTVQGVSDKCEATEHEGRSKRQVGAHQNAFYAYMTTNLQYPHPDRTFVFDSVRTNVGSGYSNATGIFTAPRAGTFVFTWTVIVDATSYVFSELAVNSVALGNIVSDSQQQNEYHTATGVAVAQLNQGDTVRVRSHPTFNIHGSVISSNTHRTSFSGWQLY